MISLSCLLRETVGCHGDSRLHLCQCVAERRFQQIDGAFEANRHGADERGEEEERKEEAEQREPRPTGADGRLLGEN